MTKPRYLLLEDGSIFKGIAFGADVNCSGEVVFTTGMSGYPESLTDSSYQGQILTFTYPLIGNYGVGEDETLFESKGIKVRGVVVSTNVKNYSHWQATQSFENWLKKENIPGISSIDTRSLTIRLRDKGTMLGVLKDKPVKEKMEDPNLTNLVSEVSIKKPVTLGSGKKRILAIDCGVKQGIIESLLQRDTTVIRVPWDFDPYADDARFDGVVISNGPGDPKMVKKTVLTVKKIIAKKIPLLGICLGNQILALAIGANTYKMKFGHRSHNQPARLKGTAKCFLTTQNHGFVVDTKTLPSGWEVWFENLNDKTNEGIRHSNLPFMAVQFHPEGKPGPYDTNWIFDEFLERVK
ncbi:glutamine-hydrolyzing carbamoyl-phosphate synthase small subunit [Candidatus Gottesmanbacteria bacterium]|nr:glutamine-hydrolyzing carbamoyl-phosphate synthase small subunit [Candidatus Gottesmanbacteria bacterium]